MGGKPCIRGMRVTVGTIVGLVASGHSFSEIIEAYPIWKRKTFVRRWPMRHEGQKRLRFHWCTDEAVNWHEPLSNLGWWVETWGVGG